MPSAATNTHAASTSNPRRGVEFPFTASAISSSRAYRGEAIYLVADDGSLREALSQWLDAHGRSIASFTTAAEYLAYRRSDEAACLILDMRLPDMSGLELQQRLANQDCPPIIFTSGPVDVPLAVSAMKAGAVEFLTRPIPPWALEAAIDLALAQDRMQRHRRLELAAIQARFNTLTPREREVLPLIAEGLLNKQAAAVLGICEVTLQVHRCQVMRKMAARSFAELVRMAGKLGIPASA